MDALKIEVPADEYEWQLYHRKVGADVAARELSVRLHALLEPVLEAAPESNTGWRRTQAARIRSEMHGHMQRFRHLGADDPEARMVLHRVLQRHLPHPE
jgi:hypothetical protein